MQQVVQISEEHFHDEVTAFAQHKRELVEQRCMVVRERAATLATMAAKVEATFEELEKLVYGEEGQASPEWSETFVESAFQRSLLVAKAPGAALEEASEATLGAESTQQPTQVSGAVASEATASTLQQSMSREAAATPGPPSIPSGPPPAQLMVSGARQRIVNGVYILDTTGEALRYMKHSSCVSLQWVPCEARPLAEGEEAQSEQIVGQEEQREQSPTSQAVGGQNSVALSPLAHSSSDPDIQRPGWCGWAICTSVGTESLAIVRGVQPAAASQPLDVRVWEARDVDREDQWRPAPCFTVEALIPAPDAVHIQDSAGCLAGSYTHREDVNERACYCREDGCVVLSWSAEEECWIAKPTAGDLTDCARSLPTGATDPSKVSAWQRWNSSTKDWQEDSGVVCCSGTFPPEQLFVHGCDPRNPCANGVYNLSFGAFNERPAYKKGPRDGGPSFQLRWDWTAWVLLREQCEGGLAQATQEVARGSLDVQRAHEVSHWGCEEGELPGMSVEAVCEAPKELFLEANSLGPLAEARGVYELRDTTQLRGRYEKRKAGGGGLRLVWSDGNSEWHLETIPMFSRDVPLPKARVAYDAPDPSALPAACEWEVWDSGVEDWCAEPGVRAMCVGVPPRRIYISAGAKGRHVLCGVYFLRGLRNGRPSYGKETMDVNKSMDRGLIFWAGHPGNAWRIFAQEVKGEFWHGRLAEDWPYPSFEASGEWEVEAQPSNSPHCSHRETTWLIAKSQAQSAAQNQAKQPTRATVGGFRLSPRAPSTPRKSGGPLAELGAVMPASLARAPPRGRSLSPKMAPNEEEEEEVPATAKEGQESLDREVKLTCVPADEAPPEIFLMGYNVELDGVYFQQDVLQDGRPFYLKQCGDLRLFWNRKEQRWMIKNGGRLRDDSPGLLSLPCDVPDPTMAVTEWEELTTASAEVPPSPPSRRSNSPSTPPPLACHMSIDVIKEEDEEDEEEDEERANPFAEELSADGESRAEEEPQARWVKVPKVSCVAVQPPPKQIFLAGVGAQREITGIYTLACAASGQQRPLYRSERVGWTTPATIRYILSQNRWVVERVPQLKGHAGLKFDLESLKFTLAGVVYDAPNPSLVPVPWTVRRAGEWAPPESPIVCRVLRPPPPKIYFLGPERKHESICGTYTLLPKPHRGRPAYQMEGGNSSCVVRYHSEARRWIVDLAGLQASNTGILVADANVPNPVEAEESHADAVWQMQDPETGKWVGEPEVGCFAGEVPPKQVYFTGGPRGLAGVYTFCFRKPVDGRCSYKKEGKGWHAWWNADSGRWAVGCVYKQSLKEAITDDPTLAETGRAFAEEDAPHPAACTAWSRPTSSAFDSAVKDEEPIMCEPVGKTPTAIVVHQRGLGVGKGLGGVYFLARDWYKHRGFFEKQCKASRRDHWTIFFSSSNAKWYVHQSGLETTKGASACAACDVPDPTFASPSAWCTKSANGGWVTDHITMESVPEAPSRLFLFGAYTHDESGPVHLPFNGVYAAQEELHCRRSFYRKEAGGPWCLRFHPEHGQWLVDGRRGAPKDDKVGACALACDCWHPAASDSYWALHEEPATKGKSLKQRASANPPSAQESGSLSQRAVDLISGQSSSVKSANVRLESTGNSPLQSSSSRRSAASSSMTSSASPSLTSSASVASMASSAVGHNSLSSIPPASQRLVGGAPSTCASSVPSGLGPKSQSSVLSSAGSVASSGNSHISSFAGFTNRSTGSSGPWVRFPSIAIIPVGPPPQTLHLLAPAPLDLAGVFTLAGEFGGRPLYELADEKGRPRLVLPSLTGPQLRCQHTPGRAPGGPEAGDQRVVPFGYCLHWSPAGCSWLLSELAKTVVVTYTFMQPHRDVQLLRDPFGFVRLASMKPGGPAATRFLPLGSVLTAINGETELWLQAREPCRCLEKVGLPAQLEFRCEGLDTASLEGTARLCYDAPHPAAVPVPWEVSEDAHHLWHLPDRPVQCRSVERPPVRLCVSGYSDKPRELNGVFEVLPMLHEGKPAYKHSRLRVAICWVASKVLWVIINIMGTSFQPGSPVNHRRAIAAASCYAPNPALVEQHGGIWQTRNLQHRRTLRVEADGPPMGEVEFRELVLSSLEGALAVAKDPGQMQCPGRDRGTIRFRPQKIREVATDLDLVFVEAVASSVVSEDQIAEAARVKRQLAGWLLLECICGQSDKAKPSLASWFEAQTRLKALLRQDGADPTVTYESDGSTALHLVARYGPDEVWTHGAASALYSFGADLEALDLKGMSPVLVAILARNFENVRALLTLVSDRGANLELQRDKEQQGEFLQLARTGSFEAMRRTLVAACSGLELDERGPDGRAALHLAAERNQANTVEILANHRADLNVLDADGNTAMHVAARNNARVTALLLIRHGASLSIRNKEGRSAYIVALESGADEVVKEFKRHMVHWSEVEAIVGKERHNPKYGGWPGLVKEKVRKLLELGFGDASTDPTHTGKTDNLQLANQIVIQEPSKEEPECSILELRGALLSKELVVPLLQLTSDCRLEASEDGVDYKHFAQYLVASGLTAFCSGDMGRVELVDTHFETAFDATGAELAALTEQRGLVLRGSGKAWPWVHQLYAHGELPWLSKNGAQRRLLGTLGALVEAGAFRTVEELCCAVAPSSEKPVSAAGTEVLLQPFWDSAYARWLVARCKKVAPVLKALFEERWGERYAGTKALSLEQLLESKIAHRKSCERSFGRPFASAGAKGPHPMEAGGSMDLLQLSLIAQSEAEVAELLSEFQVMRMEVDGLELVCVRNDFAATGRPREYKDISLGVLTRMPDGGAPVLVRVRLALRRYLELWRHKELLLSVHTDEGLCGSRGMRKVRGGRRSSFAHLLRRRWVSGGGVHASKDACVWSWANQEELKQAGQHLEPPLGAVLPMSMVKAWRELRGDATEEYLERELDLDRVSRDEWSLSDVELNELLAREPYLQRLEQAPLQRLGMELASRETRLFRDEEYRLLKVQDFVVLQLTPPDGEGTLLRESKPCGLPMGPRRASDSLQAVAHRLVHRELPGFLGPCVKLLRPEPGVGVWVERNAQQQEGVLDSARRYFVVKATLDAGSEPFMLLRAGLGI